MRKTVLSFGLLSGALSIAIMLATLPFIYGHRLETADVLGYTGMVLSALMVFFGIRAYRENAAGGRLSFARGLRVGLLITLVSCASYALAFELVYFQVAPDFGDTFSACMVERVRAAGGSPDELATAASQAETLKRLYDDPLTNAALSFATSFPIGLVATLMSAGILRKR